LTPRQRQLQWWGSHSVDWLETRVKVTGIHNYLTQHEFTPLEKVTLANGLRFIPTPSPKHVKDCGKQYLDDTSTGMIRFHRSLTSQLLRPSDGTPRVAKFMVKSKHHRSGLTETDHTDHLFDLKHLETYRAATEQQLRLLIDSAHLTERSNCSRDDMNFIRRLIDDPDVTCKPADKNLGLVLVDTSWYDTELRRMLKDRVTYTPFNGNQSKLMDKLTSELKGLVTKHLRTIEYWQPTIFPQLETFMQRKVTLKDRAIPIIYLLLKVHKKALCGRPIVPCTRWITTPASILVDHLLQEILTANPIPWLVKDTKSFVNELEHTHIVDREGVFVTADIASLYTNIDTQLGLRLVEQFLTERNVPPDRRRVIMDLLSFVMNNSYLAFRGQVYHQIDGTAMGTSCAPTYANIIVFMLERVIFAEFGSDIRLYRRFLDDVFAYVTSTAVSRFTTRMNSLHAKLKFEFVVDPLEAAFLDLNIHKGEQFARDGRFDLKTHQKAMNLYLYIPYLSMHTDAAKRSFIQTELMRYIRNSTHHSDYMHLRTLFFNRLLDRGYPRTFLVPVFTSIRYADRPLMLLPSAELSTSPLRYTQPPASTCLIKRLRRADQAAVLASANATAPPVRPPAFVIPFTPLSRMIPTRTVLLARWPLVRSVIDGLPPPIIAYRSYPSFMSLLIYMKAKRMEEKRLAASGVLPRLKQAALTLPPTVAPIVANAHAYDDGPMDMDLSSQ
jgi:hypothetical protein